MSRRREMRQHPIGTGPFKFVEFKPNESHQGGAEPGLLEAGPALSRRRSSTRSSRNRSTAILAFVAGKYELTFAGTLTIPLTRDLQKQRPDAICEMPPGSVSTNLIINREKPPFDNPELRRAMALALDRQAFIDILTDGQGFRGAAMQPPPGGQWGMPLEMLEKLPGYGPDVASQPRQGPRDHEEARLWARQAAEHQGDDARRAALSRPGGDPDRPAEGDLYRGRARADRHRRSGIPRCSARTTPWHST